ncbi:MAG: hypothetical protein CMM74_05540 [Rhodospirillaceae bacterium]|nr:hypothetical protein [Rhodospirillaceae bacterium]
MLSVFQPMAGDVLAEGIVGRTLDRTEWISGSLENQGRRCDLHQVFNADILRLTRGLRDII